MRLHDVFYYWIPLLILQIECQIVMATIEDGDRSICLGKCSIVILSDILLLFNIIVLDVSFSLISKVCDTGLYSNCFIYKILSVITQYLYTTCMKITKF